MKGKKSAHFRYAQFVFFAEILLAIYWFCVLVYVSVNESAKLLAGILFGLHYAGLVALGAIFDEATKKRESYLSFWKSSSSSGLDDDRNATGWWGGRWGRPQSRAQLPPKMVLSVEEVGSRGVGSGLQAYSYKYENNAYEGKKAEEEGRGEEEPELFGTYPLSYGTALFVAMISDLFSLVEVVLEKNHDGIGDTTYYLYTVLFGIGLCLTVSSIIWSLFTYFVNRKRNGETAYEEAPQKRAW